MTAIDPADLAHDALESLIAAESSVRRRLAADLEREGLSSSGFSVLMVLSSHGGELELRALRAKLNTSKANATEVVTTLETRGMVQRFRLAYDRRAASVRLTTQGRELVDRLVPEHTRRVADAFSVLDEAEQQALAAICRKLAAA
jgi:MarR family 2-MHQ and catechol resistance regulon transcriptional repressor